MERKLYDLRKMQEIAQGDEAFIKDMVDMFLSNVTEDISNVRTFQELEDWKAIAAIAHKLVSRFAYLNASDLQELAADIENSVLIDGNLSDINTKTEKLCSDSIILLDTLKEDLSNKNWKI